MNYSVQRSVCYTHTNMVVMYILDVQVMCHLVDKNVAEEINCTLLIFTAFHYKDITLLLNIICQSTKVHYPVNVITSQIIPNSINIQVVAVRM
jgi:hypothetical protein